MESFTRITGIAAPLLQANIDTDQIIPTRFLARLSEVGLGEGLFAEWRVLPDGSPHPGFLLNQAPWDGAEILLAGDNFGCGSSREAAPRALRDRGFRALIAPSFGDIFYSNCFRSGIVPVRLALESVEKIAAVVTAQSPPPQVTVDLQANTVQVAGLDEVFSFTCPPLLREMLLQGQDEIALTLARADAIAGFRKGDSVRRPWAYL